jgi:hypothetical protein
VSLHLVEPIDYRNGYVYDLLALLTFPDALKSDQFAPSGTRGNSISNTGTAMPAPSDP